MTNQLLEIVAALRKVDQKEPMIGAAVRLIAYYLVGMFVCCLAALGLAEIGKMAWRLLNG